MMLSRRMPMRQTALAMRARAIRPAMRDEAEHGVESLARLRFWQGWIE